MSFISYAQNFEDVMLWRALKNVEQGFYIDVGAWSPDQDSVTRAFYERGWHGINIEPNPVFHQQLQERRPHDINLKLAIGERGGTLMMNFLGNPGLSSLDDTIAEQHRKAGWSLERQPVQVTTLAEVWRQHVPAGQSVHFLKVDVEGLEESVLRGNDWQANRPWVVVVEATLPMTQTESYAAWEPILLAADYRFAYADGLNRFYVANEHPELLPAFVYPPNVFDGFVLAAQLQAEAESRAAVAEAKAQQLEAERRAEVAEARASQAEAESRAAVAEARLKQLEEQLTAVSNELHAVHQSNHQHWQLAEQRAREIEALRASTSWRLTAPLRAIKSIWQTALSKTGLKPKARLLVQHTALYVNRRPKLRHKALSVLNRYPRLKARLWSIVAPVLHSANQMNAPVQVVAPLPSEFADLGALTPRAKQIYADLKSALARRQQEGR